MQNRYVGDIGDFGKYAILRRLTGVHPQESPSLHLGIIWYLVPDETGPDGRHIGYLLPGHRWTAEIKGCDPELYIRLKALVGRNERSVAAVKRLRILAHDTVFFERMVPHAPQAEQNRSRRAWFTLANRTIAGCNLVFLDPDNGLAMNNSTRLHRPWKYAFMEEVRRLVAEQKSVVFYHHLGRNQPGRHQIREILRHLTVSRETARPFGLWYHRGTARAFIVIPSQEHMGILMKRSADLLREPWSDHFSRIG